MTTATAFDPMSEDYQQNPFGYYRAMRHEAPAYFIESTGYRDQLARYREAVRALQPGAAVRCAFITGAGELVEVD